MKKVFFALAVVAMFSFVACNGNNTEAADSTATAEEQIQEPVAEPVCSDTTTVDEPAAEETQTVADAQ